MGMLDIVTIGNKHYTFGWDTCDEGMMTLVLESDLPPLRLDYTGYTIRLYLTETDLNNLIQTLENYRDKAFGEKI